MKRLAFVIMVSLTPLAALFSGTTQDSSLEPPGVVRASEERVPVSQIQSGFTTRVSVASNGT